jgi:hypothetical protein
MSTLDPRWKNPQGNSPDQLYLWAQDLIKELRKSDYLDAVNTTPANGSITNAMLADMAAWTIKMRNNAAAGVPQNQTINDLTELTSIDTAADFFPMWDASGAAMFKAKPANFASGGETLIASGNLTGANVDIINIPATYAYLGLHLTGASHDNAASRALTIHASTNNGSSFDTTAANYVGYYAQTTPTFTNVGTGSLVGGATFPAANTCNFSMKLFGYQGNMNAYAQYSQFGAALTSFTGHVAYIGSTSAINALRMTWFSGANFDAGTYALYGLR